MAQFHMTDPEVVAAIRQGRLKGQRCGWDGCEETFTPWDQLPPDWCALVVSRKTIRRMQDIVEDATHDKVLCPTHVLALDDLLCSNVEILNTPSPTPEQVRRLRKAGLVPTERLTEDGIQVWTDGGKP